MTPASSSPSPASPQPSIAEAAAKTIPDVPRDPKTGQVIVPRAKDTPDHLKGRLISFDRPMGAGPPLRSPVDPLWAKEVREYLSEAGWEEVEVDVWRDPRAAGSWNGTPTVVKMLKDKDGNEKPLIQVVVPVAQLRFSTEQSVAIQRSRDAVESRDGEPTPLERIDQQAAVIDETTKLLHGVASELSKIALRKIPERPEQMRAEIVFLRKVASEAAARIKPRDLAQGAA